MGINGWSTDMRNMRMIEDKVLIGHLEFGKLIDDMDSQTPAQKRISTGSKIGWSEQMVKRGFRLNFLVHFCLHSLSGTRLVTFLLGQKWNAILVIPKYCHSLHY